MGEIQTQPFQLSFNASLRIDFQGSRVTSDGGLILVRELDERRGFGELIEEHLADSRRGKNTQFPFTDSAGRDGNPSIAAWLVTKILTTPKGSPRTRTREAGPVGSERVWERGTALTSRLQTFETEMLAEEENFAGLARLHRELVSSDATAVWSHAGQDRGATLASRVGEFLAGADFGGEAGVDGKVSESSVGKAALSGCRGPNDRENGCLPRSLRGSAPKIPSDFANRGDGQG